MTRKTRNTKIMMLALMFAPIIGSYAQVNENTLSKPGRLEKELGNNSKENIRMEKDGMEQ